jgi:hypothetical protein
MPGFNQKGPDGQGAMTGRRMGRCTNFGASLKKQNFTEPEVLSQNDAGNQPDVDQELGVGRGIGRGFGNGFGRGLGRGLGRGAVGRGMGRQNRFRGGF